MGFLASLEQQTIYVSLQRFLADVSLVTLHLSARGSGEIKLRESTLQMNSENSPRSHLPYLFLERRDFSFSPILNKTRMKIEL